MASTDNTPEVYPLLNTRQDNARTLITVLAIMAFIASLALVFALSANRLKTDWQSDLSRSATCLLYTSPSPRDATLSRMPSSA